MDYRPFSRFLCIALDVKSYSLRSESDQARLQRDLHDHLMAAADRSALPTEGWLTQPQGDGQLTLVPSDKTDARYVDEFIRQLAAELRRYNRGRVPAARLRLRVALHAGLARPAALGFAGDAPILACRLRDAEASRRLLASSEAGLVLIVSASLYQDLVLAEHTTHAPEDFTELAIDEDKLSVTAWYWTPRDDAPAVPGPAASPRPATTPHQHTLHQHAKTITNIEEFRADTAYIGTIVRGGNGLDDDDA